MTSIHDGNVLKLNEKVVISDIAKEKVIESEMKIISDSIPDSDGKETDSTSINTCPSETILESSPPTYGKKSETNKIYDPISIIANVNARKRKASAKKNDSNKTTIKGQIINNAGIAIPSAWVGLYSTANEIAEVLTATTYTNKYGYYIFNDIALGNYKIKSKALLL